MSRAWWMRQSWPDGACGCCASWRWDGRRICPSLAAGLRHVGLCAPFRGVLCCSQTPFHGERFARKFADFRGHVTTIVNQPRLGRLEVHLTLPAGPAGGAAMDGSCKAQCSLCSAAPGRFICGYRCTSASNNGRYHDTSSGPAIDTLCSTVYTAVPVRGWTTYACTRRVKFRPDTGMGLPSTRR